MVVDLVPNLDPLSNHSAGENERKSKMKRYCACMHVSRGYYRLYKHDLEHNHSELHYTRTYTRDYLPIDDAFESHPYPS
jgi:hypothetical protein